MAKKFPEDNISNVYEIVSDVNMYNYSLIPRPDVRISMHVLDESTKDEMVESEMRASKRTKLYHIPHRKIYCMPLKGGENITVKNMFMALIT